MSEGDASTGTPRISYSSDSSGLASNMVNRRDKERWYEVEVSQLISRLIFFIFRLASKVTTNTWEKKKPKPKTEHLPVPVPVLFGLLEGGASFLVLELLGVELVEEAAPLGGY